MLVAFKDTQPVELIRHLEYHLLLGVDHAVYIDNSCDRDAAASVSLAPYVARGLVTVFGQLRCRSLHHIARALERGQRGASSVALYIIYATPSLQPPVGSLLLPLDDDEYMVVPSNSSLRDLATRMHRDRISSVVVPWRLFGSSGLVCQPQGPVLRHFVRRAPLTWALDGRSDRRVPQVAVGKPLVLWGVDCRLKCSTHSCKYQGVRGHGERWRSDCATIGLRTDCLKGAGVYLAHYSYQSEQRMELKAKRGHTSGKAVLARRPPALYERIVDTSVSAAVDDRIRSIVYAPLRRCLTTLFAAAEAPAPRPPLPDDPLGRGLDASAANLSAAPRFVVASAANLSAVERAACAHEASPRVAVPSPARPFIFFHLRKSGGSELREALVRAAETLRLSHYIPCYAHRAGSWLQPGKELAGQRSSSAARRGCHTYGTDSLLSRPRAAPPSELPFGQSAPALYAGHMPFLVSQSLGAFGWTQGGGVASSPSDGHFDCVLPVREPVARFRSCYNERLAPALGGRDLGNLTAEELRDAVGRTDGMHTCVNEIARWVAPTSGWGEPRNSRAGLYLDADELAEARRRIDSCVVADLVDACSQTVGLLAYHFPWLAPTLHAQQLCAKCARPELCHKHSSAKQLTRHDDREVGGGATNLAPLPPQLHHAIAELNLQDLELYRHAMRRFDKLLTCAGAGAGALGDVAAHVEEDALDATTAGVLQGTGATSALVSRRAALPDNCHVAPDAKGPAVAVSLYGVHRSAAAVRSIHEGLLAPLWRVGTIDVFAHLMQPRVFDNARTGESGVRAASAASLPTALALCGFSLTEQSAGDLQLAPMLRRSIDVSGHGDPQLRHTFRKNYGREALLNLFRSRLSMKLSAELVAAHMAAHGVTYTHLVLARPDVLYVSPLLWRPDAAAEVHVPDWSHDFCSDRKQCAFAGVNDRFAIGRLPSLLPLALARLDWIWKHAIMRNSEHLWCEQLAAANVTVGLLRGLRLVRVRANGQNESMDREAPTPMAPLRCARLHGLNLALGRDGWTAGGYERSLRSMLAARPWCERCF